MKSEKKEHCNVFLKTGIYRNSTNLSEDWRPSVKAISLHKFELAYFWLFSSATTVVGGKVSCVIIFWSWKNINKGPWPHPLLRLFLVILSGHWICIKGIKQVRQILICVTRLKSSQKFRFLLIPVRIQRHKKVRWRCRIMWPDHEEILCFRVQRYQHRTIKF